MTVPIEQPLIAQSITELLEQRAREYNVGGKVTDNAGENQNDPFLHSGEAEYGFEIKTLT